ncbi:MAG: TIR domain-containing protein [Lachnospiraceae bacterium]|nr:TIR domain-containing protein [Lachnospiraceae bacterium]
MSINQYQRQVNNLDKEIADLEKKKASYDKKAAEEQRKATGIIISKNASLSTIKSKTREIERHKENARKAVKESASIQLKIADRQGKRNEAYLGLQKYQERERKDEQRSLQKELDKLRTTYENRIADLERQSLIEIREESNIIEGEKEYDVFISHASEDKESIADSLANELKSRGVTVWYDDLEIKWGDSLREKIDKGLAKSRFGIAILSPNYIAEGKYWTKTELDGLFQLDGIHGRVLLPIWHNLTKQQVIDYSPMIASRKALNTAAMTIAEIADELEKLLV